MVNNCRAKKYTKWLKTIIGELLAANVLLTSNLKLDGKLFARSRITRILIVSACSNQSYRATAIYCQR